MSDTTSADTEQVKHAFDASCGCHCCEACRAVLPTDDVLRAQLEHEASVRVRLRRRQHIRDLEDRSPTVAAAAIADAQSEYEAAVLIETKALRALHVAIAADMGVAP